MAEAAYVYPLDMMEAYHCVCKLLQRSLLLLMSFYQSFGVTIKTVLKLSLVFFLVQVFHWKYCLAELRRYWSLP